MDLTRKRLNQERADNLAEADGIIATAETENRGLSAEDTARLAELRTRRDEIDASVNELNQLRDSGAAPAATAARALPITAVHDNRADKPWGTDTGAPFGEFLMAIRAQKLSGITDPRLFASAQGGGEAIGEDGGFLVNQDMITDLSKAVNSGAVLSRVQRIPLSAGANGITIRVVKETSRATGSRWGAVQGYWVDEGTAPTASRPKLAKVELKLNKVAALGYDSGELEQDAAAYGQMMTAAFADELQVLAEDAIFNGTGAGQPQGILNAACLVSVAKETGQAAATITTTNLSAMWARFNGRNPVWFINRDVNPQLDQLSIPVGTAALEPRFVGYGPDGVLRIKGAPVVEVEYCATLGTVGDIILADMDAYGYIDGGGVQQAQSMHVAFTTDEMAYRATMRVDGQALPRSAITPFKGSNTTSPFVALATRS